MLTVTEGAKQRLKEILLDSTDDEEKGLRLTWKSANELGLVLAKGLPTDSIIEYYDGLKVLIVEPELAESLQEVILDIQDTPEGPKLTMYQRE